MSTQVSTNGGTRVASYLLAIVGLFCLVAGGALFMSHLAIAGYGIWIFVWGLAFLIGALARYGEARA